MIWFVLLFLFAFALFHINKRWREWFWSSKDTFGDLDWSELPSLILFVAAFVLLVLRRLSIWENLKKLFFAKPQPWGLEVFLLVEWIFLLSIPFWSAKYRDDPPFVFTIIALFVVVQVVQTNFYHEFWRTLGKELTTEQKEERKVFSRIRNMIIGFANIIFVNRLFGVIYWWNRTTGNGVNSFKEMPNSMADAIYFSAVTGSTLGYGEIRPTQEADFVQYIVYFQILTCLFLVGVMLSTVVGAINPLEEKKPTVQDEKETNLT